MNVTALQKKGDNFDYYSPEDIDAIKEGWEQIERGESVKFNSVEAAAAHFGFAL
ncbi:hypothetical protein FACS1894202_06060 [Clostridia bacterium]|nr:hypothetical protein FACS1894202_06060 [Clostridia bacterium]